MKAHSIGIIGGADGPTAIFVTSTVSPAWVAGIVAAVVIVACIVIIKMRKKQKQTDKSEVDSFVYYFISSGTRLL